MENNKPKVNTSCSLELKRGTVMDLACAGAGPVVVRFLDIVCGEDTLAVASCVQGALPPVDMWPTVEGRVSEIK